MTTVTRYPTEERAIDGTWTGAGNAGADDAAVLAITRGTTKNSQNDRALRGFGFEKVIPWNATINSVQIEVEHRVANTGNICFLENFVRRNGVTDGAVNSDDLEPTTLTARTYSSYARPGGGSWTPGDLYGNGFELILRARNGNNATSNTWEWDYARVTVDYTEAAVARDPHVQATTL